MTKPIATSAEKKDEAIEAEGTLLPAETKGTDIEPAKNGALVATDDDWASVDDGDLSPPDDRVGLSFPLLALNRKVDGGFVDADTGEKFRETDFIWLAKATSRAWWPEAFGKGDAAPSCRSFDGLKADPNSPDVQNQGDCVTCPHAQWGEDNPDCRESVEMMVFLPDPAGGMGRLARFRMNGLAVAPTKGFWRSFADRMPRRPAIAFLSHVKLEETETDNGTFLVPRFSRIRELAFAEAKPIIDERDRRIAEWQEHLASDIAEGAGVSRVEDEQGTRPFTAGDDQKPEYAEGEEPF